MKSSNKTAAGATLHCLTGCAIGEVLGMIMSTALGWGATASIVLSVLLAFGFGYGFSMRPLLGHGLSLRKALGVALLADTASITAMEAADNGFILLVPGAIHARLSTSLFWLSLTISLIIAFMAAFPVNKYLISRDKGHALAHRYHSHKLDKST